MKSTGRNARGGAWGRLRVGPDGTALPFFFQAEDGIRDLTVTGVQTCALPISRARPARERQRGGRPRAGARGRVRPALAAVRPRRRLLRFPVRRRTRRRVARAPADRKSVV